MKNYIEINIEILHLENSDIVTTSCFWGETDGFTTPTNTASDDSNFIGNNG